VRGRRSVRLRSCAAIGLLFFCLRSRSSAASCCRLGRKLARPIRLPMRRSARMSAQCRRLAMRAVGFRRIPTPAMPSAVTLRPPLQLRQGRFWRSSIPGVRQNGIPSNSAMRPRDRQHRISQGAHRHSPDRTQVSFAAGFRPRLESLCIYPFVRMRFARAHAYSALSSCLPARRPLSRNPLQPRCRRSLSRRRESGRG